MNPGMELIRSRTVIDNSLWYKNISDRRFSYLRGQLILHLVMVLFFTLGA